MSAAELTVQFTFADRVEGSLTAAAVGDALGGATEGWSTEQIRDRWGGYVTGVVDPYFGADWRTARPASPYHKGDGHITDDTIMTHLLAEVYVEHRRHLTAWDMGEHVVGKIMSRSQWIPELESESVPIHRLFLAEKYLALRLLFANADPREAGVGNMVNCGAAMYMAPVGVVNAADPHGAYTEAAELAGAHQSSYGREAAAVIAAAVAAAMHPAASLTSVLDVVVDLAKDGTRQAIEAVLDAAEKASSWQEAIERGVLRDAIRPFDTVGEAYREPGLDARRPSRTKSIEELPIALGMLKVSGGDTHEAILGGVNYGRDSDSIASMAGAIGGALHGTAALPAGLVDQVSAASRLDLRMPARSLATAACEIRKADVARLRRLANDISVLVTSS